MRGGDLPCKLLLTEYDGVYCSSLSHPSYPEELFLTMKCFEEATMKLAKEDITPEHYQVSTESDEIPILILFDVVDIHTSTASSYGDEATLTQWITPRPLYLEDLVSWTGDVETWDIET